ncbi:MAG: hypothetical protein J07AB43_01850 [Candidatus Nanosalina sp. J07AB43]|nr:MAG: hypothetical protein J07AB43_01850 [Candidatus Nanosalina sp. J07AB43]
MLFISTKSGTSMQRTLSSYEAYSTPDPQNEDLEQAG